VGLSNTSPWDSAPVWLEYALCGRYLGPTLVVPTNFTIPCGEVGNANRYRYVIVQSAHPTFAAICLAEVQVFVNGMKKIFGH